MKATKHRVKCKPFSFKCVAYHKLKRPIAPFDSNRNAAENDLEHQLLKTQIWQGFHVHKHELPKLVHPQRNVRDDLLISDDDFVLKDTCLVIPASLREQADLNASHRGIDGTKARARLIVYWPGIDNDITNTCRSCFKCEFD